MKENLKKQKNILWLLLVIGVILIILGMGTVIATTSIVKKSSIGKEKAQNFAFVDAGVDPVKVIVLSNKFDFEDGQFVYEIEFVSEGIKYEYCIKASDGSIIEKEIDDSNTANSNKNIEEKEQTTSQSSENNKTNTNKGNQQVQSSTQTSTNKTDKTNSKNITLEKAKNNALSNAGESSSKATFTKAKLDEEDGILVYEIEFYTQTHKYEYEINATTGAVHKHESKKLKTSSNANDKYIGMNKAKSIALNHAKVSSSEVIFKKAKLDEEDDVMIYEIEFEKGNTEYEYEINALTGNIIKYEID